MIQVGEAEIDADSKEVRKKIENTFEKARFKKWINKSKKHSREISQHTEGHRGRER